MPSKDTFDVKPIGELVKKYLAKSNCSVDPFARNKQWATYTNDINPATQAAHHMDAVAFLQLLRSDGVQCDLLLLDPPYSPRQISECYASFGRTCTGKDTQNAALYKRVKDAALSILTDNARVISFGWNSVGMGIGRGFAMAELLVVCHGAAHNDTLCVVEERTKT